MRLGDRETGGSMSLCCTCLGVTQTVHFRVQLDHFQADLGGLALIGLGLHLVGGQDHVAVTQFEDGLINNIMGPLLFRKGEGLSRLEGTVWAGPIVFVNQHIRL